MKMYIIGGKNITTSIEQCKEINMLSNTTKVVFCILPLVSLALKLTVVQTLALSLTLLILGILIGKGSEENYRLPPGPRGLPIIGSFLPVLYYGADEYFFHLYQKYGSMVTVKMGSLRNILINDYETMKEFSNNLEFQGRLPSSAAHDLTQGHGIINTEGQLWRHQRRFMMHSLRDSGMGKIKMEEKISSELETLTSEIAKANEKPIDLDSFLQKTTFNVILDLSCNKSFEFNDPILKSLLHSLDQIGKLITKLGFMFLVKALRVFTKGIHKALASHADVIQKQADIVIQEHKESLDVDNPRDYIDLFLTEAKKDANSDNTGYQNTFTEKQLRNVIFDIFLAGTETSNTTIRWAILCMLNYPEIQTKVQEEIDGVTGGNRALTVADKPNLPFTMATLQEVERIATIVPQGLVRSNPAQAKFREYLFPERCSFMLNIYAIHRDPKLWKNPEEFRPERFINDKGNVFRPAYLVPFGLGKRSCAGEAIARMEIYLLFATLMHKFSFLPPQGKVPDIISRSSGGFRIPKPFEVVAKLRN